VFVMLCSENALYFRLFSKKEGKRKPGPYTWADGESVRSTLALLSLQLRNADSTDRQQTTSVCSCAGHAPSTHHGSRDEQLR
jgi:hypothetical protein